MTRTTVTIDDEKLDALRSLAAERGVSVSCLVREAIDDKLSSQAVPSAHLSDDESAPRFQKPRAIGVVWTEDAIPARQLGNEIPEIPPWR